MLHVTSGREGMCFEGDRQEFDTLRTLSCGLFGLSGREVGAPDDWNVVLSTNGTNVTYKIASGAQMSFQRSSSTPYQTGPS